MSYLKFPALLKGVLMRDRKTSLSGSYTFVQRLVCVSIVLCVVTWTWGCDSGAEKRARAMREVAYLKSTERVLEAVHVADTEIHHTVALAHALQGAKETMSLAIAEGKKASARRSRVEKGLRRLIEEQRESDPNADSMCERFKYPCNSADVPQEISQRTMDVGLEVSDRIKQGESVDEVVEWLLQLEGIEHIDADQSRIWFQFDGGVPMPVIFRLY